MNSPIAADKIILENRSRNASQAALVVVVCLCATLLVGFSGLTA